MDSETSKTSAGITSHTFNKPQGFFLFFLNRGFLFLFLFSTTFTKITITQIFNLSIHNHTYPLLTINKNHKNTSTRIRIAKIFTHIHPLGFSQKYNI